MLSEVPEGWSHPTQLSIYASNETRKWNEVEALPYIGLEHIEQGTGRLLGFGESQSVTSAKNVFEPGDVLFGKLRPNLRKYWKADRRGICSTDILVLRGKQGLESDYLFAVVQSEPFLAFAENDAAGTKMPRTSWKRLETIELPIPPLNEQHRIAEILFSVDASIQATQAVIEQAERVKRGLMEELLTGGLGSEAIERGEVPEGWEATTIGAVCEIARGGSPRPIDKFMTDAEDGINWIKIGDASASSKYIYTTKEKIKPEGEKKSRRVHSGDFLLSNSMSFGRPYILRTDGCIHDGWLSLSFDRQALGEEFLYYLLSSPLVFNQFSDKAAGSAVKNLNKDLVSSVKIALPPYEEQKRIEEILGDLDALMLSQRTLIEQQNRTKRGLMDDLLTGKVRTV